MVVRRRVPNIFIYSFMLSFVYSTIIVEYILYIKYQDKYKNEQNNHCPKEALLSRRKIT